MNIEKLVKSAFILWALIVLIISGGIVCVVVHFLGKYW